MEDARRLSSTDAAQHAHVMDGFRQTLQNLSSGAASGIDCQFIWL